jgi:hypothetical protein
MGSFLFRRRRFLRVLFSYGFTFSPASYTPIFSQIRLPIEVTNWTGCKFLHLINLQLNSPQD